MKLAAPGKQDLRRIKKLYRAAFPRIERKPFYIVPRQCKNGEAELFAMETDGGEFAGFALVATAKSADIVMLSYFAVEAELRGRGIGSEALKTLMSRYADSRFILEIESVNSPCSNLEARQRRRRFYLNNGMISAGFTARVFSTDLEVLTAGKPVSFEEYQRLYSGRLGEKVLKKVTLNKETTGLYTE